MHSTPPFSTRQRILGAAEELFAERGFAGASLRQVTAAANVNLAAVNYHFGSKDNLIEEVFRRRLDELSRRRLERLAAIEAAGTPTLEAVLHAFITPALELSLEISRRYGFQLRSDDENNQRIFGSLASLSAHIEKNRAK